MTRQDQAFNLLCSKFPKRYGVKGTRYLRGLLKAIAEGDGYVAELVEQVRDNLTSAHARGRHLDRIAGNYGVVRTQGSGVLDEDFRHLIPLLGMGAKQVAHTLQAVIDGFYGPYSSRANVQSALQEPFDVSGGKALFVLVDGHSLEARFSSSDCANPAAATAEELALAVTAKTGGIVIGSAPLDARTGRRTLNLRTRTLGPQGFIQVVGGDAQAVLRFPDCRPVTGGAYTWTVSRHGGTSEMLYSMTAGAGLALKAAGVRRGDLVTVRTDSGLAAVNCGTFRVTAVVSPTDFRVENGSGLPQAGVTNLHASDFTFFRPRVGNVLQAARPAAAVETQADMVTVILPVTAPVVKKRLAGSHHFHGGMTVATASAPGTLTLSSVQGFPASGSVRRVSSRLSASGTVSIASGSDVTLVDAGGWPASGAFWSPSQRQFYYYQGVTGSTLNGVTPAPPSALAGDQVRYAERFRYTGVSGQDLTGVYPSASALVGSEVMSEVALDPDFRGSFVYDGQASFVAASSSSVTAGPIRQGQSRTVLAVGDVSGFPARGHVVFEFGTGRQEGPVRYLSKVGTNGLVLDPGHVFTRDHATGVGVRLVRLLGPYQPRRKGEDLPVYLTSSAPARDLLAQYLRQVAASGVALNYEIRTPDYKWAVLPNLHSTSPLSTSLVGG